MTPLPQMFLCSTPTPPPGWMPSAPPWAPWGSEMSSQLATFTLAGAHYGVDMLRVQEALRDQARTTVPLAAPRVAGLINLRGQVVLTIDLRTRLGLEPRAQVDGQDDLAAQVDQSGDAGRRPRADDG